MDFTKLQQEVKALLEKSEKPAEPAEKKMTAAEFQAYATDQIAKAQAEHEAGKSDLSKKRLTALKAEADKIAKYDYKAGELPNVVIYKDAEQLETTEEERSVQALARNQATGADNWTAKSSGFSKLLGEALSQLGDNRPNADKPSAEAEQAAKAEDAEWPTDLAASIKKSRRDEDKDYQWGADAR